MTGSGTLSRAAGFAAVLGAVLSACNDSASAPPADAESLLVQGVVRDTTGAPLEGALTMMHVFSPDSFPYWPPASSIADSLGGFALFQDSLGTPPIDSVYIETMAPGCTGSVQTSVIQGSVIPAGAAPTLDVAVEQQETWPPARTQPGQYCAFGMHPFWGPGAYDLLLSIDSISGVNVWGRWALTYQFSSSGDEGTFVGGATASFVVLQLTQEGFESECHGDMQLYVPVRADGTWGPAEVVGAQDCVPDPARFTFVADTIPWTFP